MTPASRPRRLRLVWTREFAVWFGVVVLVGVVGWLKSINLLSLLAYLMVGVFLVNALLAWRMVRKVSADRTPPPPLFAGEPVILVGSVTNASVTRAVVSVRETTGPAPRSWFLPAVPPGATLPFTGPVEFARRGRYPLPPLEAVSGYPFGIVQVRRPLFDAGEVWVLPPLGFVDLLEFRRWLVRSAALEESSQRVLRRAVPTDGDVRGVRPYRTGDSPRDVHWRTSARRDQLMVREYDRSPPLDLTVVVDPWVPSVPTDRLSLGKLEWALSLAVSVAWAWVHGELPGDLTLLVGGPEWTARSGPGTPAFVRTAFRTLAETPGYTALAPLPPNLFRPAVRSSRLLVTTRASGPLPGELRATGLGVAIADPGMPLPWFTPKPPGEPAG
jgi:uncharacterized protein (DUF58 family)